MDICEDSLQRNNTLFDVGESNHVNHARQKDDLDQFSKSDIPGDKVRIE
jgi:hypothetical protein